MQTSSHQPELLAASMAIDRASGLLERDDVLARLDEILRRAKSGSGKVVAISGEAGIGKTSLLREVEQCARGHMLVMRGSCEDLGTPRPLGPLFDMANVLTPEVRHGLTHRSPHGQLFNSLLEMLGASSLPVLMIIEDMHWSDQSTVDLVRFLGRRVSRLPLVLMISLRSDDPGSDLRIGRMLGDLNQSDLERCRLEPLSPQAVSILAEAAGHDGRHVHEVSRGNPFFVTEILANGDGRSKQVPVSIRDAVWARIHRYPPAAVRMMHLLSLIPSGASRSTLGELVDRDALDEIDRLLSAGILVERADARLLFRHELARRAVLEQVPAPARREWHALIGKALEALGEGGDPAVLAMRFFHAAEAGNGIQVIALAPTIAAHAAQIGSHRQAAQYLAEALKYAGQMDVQTAAQTYETWSYEAGIAEKIDSSVISARHKAIDLWGKLGRIDKVGHNLRWLSRMHWYLGEAEESERQLLSAITLLETIEPCDELAWSYSVRSQTAMLRDEFAEAIHWGNRALALAETLGNVEVRVHSLNNIGSSLLFSGDPVKGEAMMKASLALALEHDLHEQAARVYTNLSEYAIAERDLAMAEKYLSAGIAFDTDNDLDAWLHYLRGCQAQFLLLTGDLAEAAVLASTIIELTHVTSIMKMGAALVLGTVEVRRGTAGGRERLIALLAEAEQTREPQRIVPVQIALAEAAWLDGDLEECARCANAALSMAPASKPWEVADSLFWLQRAGRKPNITSNTLPEAARLELNGDYAAAAAKFRQQGLRYHQALALVIGADHCDQQACEDTCAIFAEMGAESSAARVRELVTGFEPSAPMLRKKRGPYGLAKQHPLGLSAKEEQVLQLLRQGASNREIAEALHRSVRTIEHHVSALIDKMQVRNRHEAAHLKID